MGGADLGDGPRALPGVEIMTDGLHECIARCTPAAATFRCPAHLAQEAAQVTVAAHQALGYLSCTDAIVTSAGKVVILDG